MKNLTKELIGRNDALFISIYDDSDYPLYDQEIVGIYKFSSPKDLEAALKDSDLIPQKGDESWERYVKYVFKGDENAASIEAIAQRLAIDKKFYDGTHFFCIGGVNTPVK